MSITIWSIETRPTTGKRRPQISTLAWGESSRDPVGVPDREDAQMGGTIGDMRAGVPNRRAGRDRRRVHDRCGQTGRAVHLHGPEGIDADQTRPDADHADVCRRVGHRPRRDRKMGKRGTEPRRTDRLLRLVHAGNRRRVRHGVGPVGQRKMPHDTHDAEPPSLLTTLSETDQFVPLPAGAAATGHPGVYMETNPHRRRGVRNKRAELVHRPDRDVDPGGCRHLGVDPGGVQPGEDRHRQPLGAQRRGPCDARRPEPPGTGRNGGSGDRDGAVAVTEL